MRTFLLKAKHFFRRNIYPITVSMCTVLVLGIITLSAYSAIKESNSPVIDTTTPIVSENNQPADNIQDDTEKQEPQKPSDDKVNEPAKPVVVAIIFDLPFENASIMKNYTDSSLVYDATTNLWCTHQAIDFSAVEGQQVKAVYDGIVEKIESSMMYGTVVYLKISNELTVVYKGLSADVFVKEGDQIKKGALIGAVTSFLAEKADGVHLHLELLKNNKLSDPNEYFSFNK